MDLRRPLLPSKLPSWEVLWPWSNYCLDKILNFCRKANISIMGGSLKNNQKHKQRTYTAKTHTQAKHTQASTQRATQTHNHANTHHTHTGHRTHNTAPPHTRTTHTHSQSNVPWERSAKVDGERHVKALSSCLRLSANKYFQGKAQKKVLDRD